MLRLLPVLFLFTLCVTSCTSSDNANVKDEITVVAPGDMCCDLVAPVATDDISDFVVCPIEATAELYFSDDCDNSPFENRSTPYSNPMNYGKEDVLPDIRCIQTSCNGSINLTAENNLKCLRSKTPETSNNFRSKSHNLHPNSKPINGNLRPDAPPQRC